MPESFRGGEIASAMSAASAVADPVASPATTPTPTAAGVRPAEGTATTPQAVGDGNVTTTPESTTTPTDQLKSTVPPEDRWPTILANARTKAAQETEAKYQWATQIPEQHRTTVGEFYQVLETDPATAIEALIVTAANDPTHAPKLRSLLGRLLGNRGTPDRAAEARPATAAAAFPEPDFQDEQGHAFYSAGLMREAFAALEAKIDAKYANELRPLQTDLQTRDERARQAEAKHAADKWAEARYAKVSQWPHYKAHEAAILAALEKDPGLDVGDAYIEIVIPALSQLERASVVASQHDKVSASMLSPSTSTSAASHAPKTFKEGFAQVPAATMASLLGS